MTETAAVQELMLQGVNLMLLGMGTVFVLLGLLVFGVGAMSRFAIKIGGVPAVPGATPAPAAGAPPSADATLLAVISAAVHRYRRTNGR